MLRFVGAEFPAAKVAALFVRSSPDRGRRVPAIAGHYFYSDYCAGWIRSFRMQNGTVVDRREWKTPELGHVVSFGEDAAGELYILTESGRVMRIAAAG